MRRDACDHGRGCKKKDLRAQFTMKIGDITKGSLPQPQFYCENHRELHPNVSPTTGTPMGGEDAKTP